MDWEPNHIGPQSRVPALPLVHQDVGEYDLPEGWQGCRGNQGPAGVVGSHQGSTRGCRGLGGGRWTWEPGHIGPQSRVPAVPPAG